MANSTKGKSGTAAELLRAMIDDDAVAEFSAVEDNEGGGDSMFAAYGENGGQHVMFMRHFREVSQNVDSRVAKGLLAHEMMENYLFAMGGRWKSYSKRHKVSLLVESQVLREMDSNLYRRGGMNKDNHGTSPFLGKNATFTQDFGKFKMKVKRAFGGRYTSFSRVDK